MYTRFTTAPSAVLGMRRDSPATRGVDTWPMPMARYRTYTVVQHGGYQNDLTVYPGKLTLQEGSLYRVLVINPSETTQMAATGARAGA